MRSSDRSARIRMTQAVARPARLSQRAHRRLGSESMMTSRMPASLLGASANEKVVVAVIGVNGRGQVHAQNFARGKNTEVAYVCDVDSTVLGKVLKQTQDAQTRAPKAIDDFRRALDDKAVDAVSIATPDHWHAPMALLAMKAGKHVYLEKPCGHNPREGELLGRSAEEIRTRRADGHAATIVSSERSKRCRRSRTARSDTRISCARGTRIRAPGSGTASRRRFRRI